MKRKKVLMLASVASMIDQFSIPNIQLMQGMGYEVHAACNYRQGNTCDAERLCWLKGMLRDMHVIQHQWDCPRSIRCIQTCINAYQQLWKLTGKYDFAWMHCQSPIGGALARMIAHRRHIRVIYTAHGFHFYKGAPIKNWLFYYPVEKLLAYWTDALVTVNQEDYLSARQRLCAKKIYYIPGIGVDTSRFRMPQGKKAAFCSRYGIPEGAVVLLSVGELNKGKNHKAVITALAKLSRQDVYYLICGQGGLRAGLQKYADRLGVGSRLRMPGYQADMPWIYQNADIFVFPSVREGMPAALMEAMAAGLPCIVSDIRGSRELIDDAAVRFSRKKSGELLAALERMTADEHMRHACGEYNRKKIAAYDRAVVQEKMKAIYEEIGQTPADIAVKSAGGETG